MGPPLGCGGRRANSWSEYAFNPPLVGDYSGGSSSTTILRHSSISSSYCSQSCLARSHHGWIDLRLHPKRTESFVTQTCLIGPTPSQNQPDGWLACLLEGWSVGCLVGNLHLAHARTPCTITAVVSLHNTVWPR